MTLFLQYILANSLFAQAKAEDIKDGTKLFIKALSLVVVGLIFTFQIPIVCILLQGYLCNEDPISNAFTLEDVYCGTIKS